MLADPLGTFTKAIGMDINLAGLGGLRSKRYSLVIKGGKVAHVNVEVRETLCVHHSMNPHWPVCNRQPDNTGLTCSLSNAAMEQL